jgi:hypothetical protein
VEIIALIKEEPQNVKEEPRTHVKVFVRALVDVRGYSGVEVVGVVL